MKNRQTKARVKGKKDAKGIYLPLEKRPVL